MLEALQKKLRDIGKLHEKAGREVEGSGYAQGNRLLRCFEGVRMLRASSNGL